MPLFWVLAQRAGQASPATQAAAQQLDEALTVAGYMILAGIAYWFGSDNPKPVVDTSIEFDPEPSWACSWHPQGSCLGSSWGCEQDLL